MEAMLYHQKSEQERMLFSGIFFHLNSVLEAFFATLTVLVGFGNTNNMWPLKRQVLVIVVVVVVVEMNIIKMALSQDHHTVLTELVCSSQYMVT